MKSMRSGTKLLTYWLLRVYFHLHINVLRELLLLPVTLLFSQGATCQADAVQ